jgi:hypothetical protein
MPGDGRGREGRDCESNRNIESLVMPARKPQSRMVAKRKENRKFSKVTADEQQSVDQMPQTAH